MEDAVVSKVRDNDGLHKRRGIWHYKLKVGGRWREFSSGTTNYQAARKARQQALQQQEEGRLPTDTARWPFEKAAADWLADRERAVAPQTLRIDRERLKPLLRVFSGRRLCEFTPADVRTYQARRMKEVGNRTINLETKGLRMILKRSRLWARIADDYKALPENTRGPGRALLPSDERHLFETAASNPNWGVAYLCALVAANTTARGCELKGLLLSDVDLEAGTMGIRRASTKTDAGCRVIPLNQTAKWALTRLIERAQSLGASTPECYVLPAANFRRTKGPESAAGTGFNPHHPQKTWRTAWRALLKVAAESAGRAAARAALGNGARLGEAKAAWRAAAKPFMKLRFHDLRHHSITKLAEAGVPEQTLMAIAGHVSREMLEHYSHIRLQAKRDAVTSIENFPAQVGVEAQTARPN